MFHDSKIASNYRMSYTKCQYVIEFALKPFILEMLRDDFDNTPFTFKFDETTTVQIKKQYDGYVQYYSKKLQRITSHYCGSLFVGHCKAEQLRNHFFEFGHYLKWKINYLLHLGMDGPKVNLKFENDLVAELKSVHNKTILNVLTCNLHPVHNAFAEGLKKSITFPYDKFAIDLHFSFKHSAARRGDFVLCNLASELDISFMRRHVSSRWVSLKNAYVRINEQWDHLCTYFLTYLPKQKNFASDIEGTERYKNITSILKAKDSLIYINFVIYIAGILESYLIPMESNESNDPKIHVMYTNMGTLMYKLMCCFVKNSVLLDSKGIRTETCELGNLEISKHLKSIHAVEI